MEPWTLRRVTVRDLDVALRERGNGPPVLLVHGNASSSVWWEPALDRVPHTWHWLAPDLRGRGETIGPSAGWTIPSLARDLVGVLDALDVEAAHLVGHSLGANVAMELALEAPGRVRSLCLLNPGWVAGDIPAPLADDARLAAVANQPALLRVLLRAVAPKHPEGPAWDRLVTSSLRQTPDATLEGGRAYRQWNVAARLHELRGPVTILRGEGDVGLSTAALCESLARAIAGAVLVTIPNATHAPNVEQPVAFVAALMDHLRRKS